MQQEINNGATLEGWRKLQTASDGANDGQHNRYVAALIQSVSLYSCSDINKCCKHCDVDEVSGKELYSSTVTKYSFEVL